MAGFEGALASGLLKPIFVLTNTLLFILSLPIAVAGLAASGKLSKNVTYIDLFQVCLRLPLGDYFIKGLILLTAGYTSSIGPRLTKLELLESKNVQSNAEMVVRPWHKNPFNSCHAAALCNFGEFAGGIAMMAKMQVTKPRVRGIPVSLKTTFLQKARGVLTGECTTPSIPDLKTLPADVTVVTKIYDSKRVLVAETEVVWTLSPAKRRSKSKKDE